MVFTDRTDAPVSTGASSMSAMPQTLSPVRFPKERPVAHRRRRRRQPGTYVPLVLTMSWSLATVAAFAWGPFKYDILNAGQLYRYLLFAHVAIIAGFLLGSRAAPRRYGLRLKRRIIVRTCVLVSLGFFL